MNKKGQALVEFILILPVILLIMMSLIDIGNIFLKKHELNKDLQTISELYINDKKQDLLAYASKEDIIFSESKTGELITLKIEKKIPINAPVLSSILGKNYQINASKSIYGD